MYPPLTGLSFTMQYYNVPAGDNGGPIGSYVAAPYSTGLLPAGER